MAKTETPVYMVFWYDKIRIKLSTGEKIKPKFWNAVDHRARETKQFSEGQNLNTRLDGIETDIMNTARDHLTKNNGIISNKLAEDFKMVLKPVPVITAEKLNFFDTIRKFIKFSTKTPRTIISYNATLKVLEGYQNTIKNELSFEDIDLDFYDNFLNYLITVRKFAKNTIGGHIKEIKVFMNYALDKGYTTNRGHLHRKFKKLEETAETIYLTDQDLFTLWELDLSKKPKLDRVRDLFIIGCYTGLRFSDLSQLTPENFIKNGTQLKIKTVKTGEMVIIPLHWTIKEILNKYDGRTPRPISNQKMNEYLKKLGEEGKLTEKVILNRTKGGLIYGSTFEKWQLITVHTARRSFATNMYLAEVPSISIMKITGHRTESAFMKYIKITQEQNADKLSNHPYFTKAPLKVVNQ